jgi:hypothetical protein
MRQGAAVSERTIAIFAADSSISRTLFNRGKSAAKPAILEARRPRGA